jgi:outer membrane murein-binding lipoprotein Lpp
MIGEVQDSIFNTAQYLGIATDSLNNFSYNFTLSLKGLSEDAKMQRISEEVTKLGDSFAALLPKIGSVAELQAVYEERINLEVRLLQVLGDTQALRDRELAATSDYNKAILQQIFAAEDAKTAMQELNSALNSLSENDYATLLDFRRAQASVRMGLPVANDLGAPAMPTSGASVISSVTSTTSGEVAQLRSDMKEMHKEVMFAYSKLIKNSKDSRDTLRGWDIVGIPPERTA